VVSIVVLLLCLRTVERASLFDSQQSGRCCDNHGRGEALGRLHILLGPWQGQIRNAEAHIWQGIDKARARGLADVIGPYPRRLSRRLVKRYRQIGFDALLTVSRHEACLLIRGN
jgi:hypothetical protein